MCNSNAMLLSTLDSPRDSTGGLGAKMVEYVLSGSPTTKDSPLGGLEPRLSGLKFEDSEKVSFRNFLASGARFLILSFYVSVLGR